jgi:choline-glycine betaine transporter
MKIISSINSYIYIVLVAFLLLFGPTKFLLNVLVETIGSFIQNFIPSSFNADAFNVGNGWSGGWTIFFWAWWMAYAPLIGMFLARIAIGRTIRQFILVNIFVPGAFLFIWFTAFGGSAIYYEHFQQAGIMDIINAKGLEVSMYALFQNMPLRSITIPVGIAALGFSFITLADAMTSTIASMTIKNNVDEEAPQSLKVFWGFLIGGVTIVCLLVSGTVGTQALQSMSIVFALPIFIFGCAVLISIFKMAAEVEKEKEEKEVIRSVKLTLDDEVKSPSEVDNKVLNSL